MEHACKDLGVVSILAVAHAHSSCSDRAFPTAALYVSIKAGVSSLGKVSHASPFAANGNHVRVQPGLCSCPCISVGLVQENFPSQEAQPQRLHCCTAWLCLYGACTSSWWICDLLLQSFGIFMFWSGYLKALEPWNDPFTKQWNLIGVFPL